LKKKKLLIIWGNAYHFNEVIAPIISNLSENFAVSIVLVRFHLSADVVESLKLMANQHLLEKYWFIPDSNNILKQQVFLKMHEKIWRENNYDVLLTNAEMQVFERFFISCVLPRHCLKICFWPTITYLLQHESLVGELLERQVPAPDARKTNSNKANIIIKGIEKIKEGMKLSRLLRMAMEALKNRIASLYQNIYWFLHEKASRYLAPAILFGKTFPLGKYDVMTQLGSGRSDAYVFCDEIEAKAFSKLFNNQNVYTVKYPTQGNCHCHNNKSVSALLIVLSTFADFLSDNMGFFYNDINMILEKTRLNLVHLRVHPAVRPAYYYYLRDYLRAKGIDAIIVDNNKPIREVACDYLAIVAIHSNALRDARACCDHVLVYGLEDVARKMFGYDVRQWYGKSEGIIWIGKNNTYAADSFEIKKYFPPVREGVDNLILRLANKGIDV